MTTSDERGHDEVDPDQVGTVGEEAIRLLRALGGSAATDLGAGPHQCPNGWCPACQVVGFVRDHPEVVATVTDSAATLLRAMRDAFDTTPTTQDAP